MIGHVFDLKPPASVGWGSNMHPAVCVAPLPVRGFVMLPMTSSEPRNQQKTFAVKISTRFATIDTPIFVYCDLPFTVLRDKLDKPRGPLRPDMLERVRMQFSRALRLRPGGDGG